jgi:hypothetical protein
MDPVKSQIPSKRLPDLDETVDDYVVFPELYPHLRKNKGIKKPTEGEKKQRLLRNKRESKK